MVWPTGTSRAIARSLRMYYRDEARVARMDGLNAAFLRPGGLAFDIGAHVGDRTDSFRRLGARVVAVEPQPAVFRALRLIHGRAPGVTLCCAALGAAPGNAALYINSANPTVSTVSRALVEAAPGAAAWDSQIWDQQHPTPMITLDRLIAEHGQPDFIKIDVEGHEAEVLAGLSHPVDALSFEFTTLQREVAAVALKRLEGLGSYRFNLSLGEEHRLRFDPWVDAATMADTISTLPEAANSGDVYARLTETPRY